MLLNNKNRIIWLTILSVAMAFLETAVVIYLRTLFYSEGFSFPINPIEDSLITLTELLREAATIIMLLSIGYLFGKNFITRFAAFLYSFAIWDIFYYVFLKLMINWPESLFTWDVLFLIPVTWVGPVIAPVLVSMTMILYAYIFLKSDEITTSANPNTKEWLIMFIGVFIILTSFIIDSSLFIMNHFGFGNIFNLNSDDLFGLMQEFIPQKFRWWIFIIGEAFLLLSISLYRIRVLKEKKSRS